MAVALGFSVEIFTFARKMDANMHLVSIRIDWVRNNFAACIEDERIACVAAGKTLDEVKDLIVDGLKFHIEGMLLHGDPVPPEYQEAWIPEFHLTTRAQLRYADTYITRKALARETGINEQQLCHYATGRKNPRPETSRKILAGIKTISQRLALIL